ncbi:hypothetical protein V8D89_000135 [Ganoderma adspersum]
MHWNFVAVKDWMSTCLPGTNPTDSVFQPFNVVLNKNEAAMYPGICNGINDILQQIDCAEFLAYCTADLPDNTVADSDTLDIMDTSPIKVDLSIIPKNRAKPHSSVHQIDEPSAQPAVASAGRSSSSPSPAPSQAPLGQASILHTAATHPLQETTAQSNLNVGPLSTEEAVSDDGSSERQPPRAECSWHWAEVLVEVKLHSKYFAFPPKDPTSDGAEHVQSRGQLALYASQILRMQHRTHVYLISISGKYAQLVRFDRSGAIISESFDYTTATGVAFIGQFLHCLFNPSASPEDRGADPTTTLASNEEASFFSSLHERLPMGSTSRIARRFKEASSGADESWPVYALNITSPWSQLGSDQTPLPVVRDIPAKTHRCLVGKPLFTSRSLMGRGTKCFVGWDLDANRPVMIKDSWRAELSGIGSEFDTYTMLWEGQTTLTSTHIPTPLGGGDVYHMEGNTREYQRTPLLAVPVLPGTSQSQRTPRIHTRLVLKEICETLESFTNAEHLVGMIFHALMAHSYAWRTHKILHRDISVHNILIYYPDPNSDDVSIGLLSDWDLARTEEQLQQGALATSRSGTWQFMSALLQCMRDKHYEVSDDLESFTHVLNWCTLRFLPNKWSNDPHELASRMNGLFDRHVNQKLKDGTIVSTCGVHKLTAIRDGELLAPVEPPEHPFATLLNALADLCQQHYSTYDIDQIIAKLQKVESGQDPTVEPQSTEPNPSLPFYQTGVMGSDMSLDWLAAFGRQLQSGNASMRATSGPPTTPTRPSSSRPSPPPTRRTRTVNDRSKSPLLNHGMFMYTILEALPKETPWHLLPKTINALEPQSLAAAIESSSFGTSTGYKRRSTRGDDEDYANAKRKTPPLPSSQGSSKDDDPFLDNSSKAAAPVTHRGRADEEHLGNAATQLFRRANQADTTRTARRRSRTKSPKTTLGSSRSASPTT